MKSLLICGAMLASLCFAGVAKADGYGRAAVRVERVQKVQKVQRVEVRRVYAPRVRVQRVVRPYYVQRVERVRVYDPYVQRVEVYAPEVIVREEVVFDTYGHRQVERVWVRNGRVIQRIRVR